MWRKNDEKGIVTMPETTLVQEVKATYEPPRIAVLSEEEVLRAFQMTAAQIGAAAVWWSASCSAC